MLMCEFTGNSGRKNSILGSIKHSVKHLYHRYGITRDEIVSILITKFQDRERHLKYDPDQSSLESYVAWFVYYEMLTLKERCRKDLEKSRTVPLSELDGGEKVSRIGCSIKTCERQGIDSVIDSRSPEDEIIGKELLQMALDFFGGDDVAVLLGARDRSEEAGRLSIDYYAYCKRLKRKTIRFKSFLEDIGYLD
jgi:hypothetical protein